MAFPKPGNANDFIEDQLHDKIFGIEEYFSAQALSFSGPIVFGVDNLVRSAIEELKILSNKRTLVVILTTTGGYIEVVQRIVDTIRHHYKIVNFVIPNYAYSAGTVFAMSGDSIYMDYYSRLGPIDPQVENLNGRMVPALGYLEEYNRLIEKAQQGKITRAEIQLLISGFDQAELYQYEQARELSIALLTEWLAKYKFKNWKITETRKLRVNKKMREERAAQIAAELNKTERWHVHGYGISMNVLQNDKDLKLKIDDFDEDEELEKIVREYYDLLDDYMVKRSYKGVVHTCESFQPYLFSK